MEDDLYALRRILDEEQEVKKRYVIELLTRFLSGLNDGEGRIIVWDDTSDTFFFHADMGNIPEFAREMIIDFNGRKNGKTIIADSMSIVDTMSYHDSRYENVDRKATIRLAAPVKFSYKTVKGYEYATLLPLPDDLSEACVEIVDARR